MLEDHIKFRHISPTTAHKAVSFDPLSTQDGLFKLVRSSRHPQGSQDQDDQFYQHREGCQPGRHSAHLEHAL